MMTDDVPLSSVSERTSLVLCSRNFDDLSRDWWFTSTMVCVLVSFGSNAFAGARTGDSELAISSDLWLGAALQGFIVGVESLLAGDDELQRPYFALCSDNLRHVMSSSFVYSSKLNLAKSPCRLRGSVTLYATVQSPRYGTGGFQAYMLSV